MTQLDCRHMWTPFLRVTKLDHTPAGDDVVQWDLRITTPNVAQVSASALHTLVHFLDLDLHARNPLITQVRPNGSHTGLTITAINLARYHEMANLVADALLAVTTATQIPRVDPTRCAAVHMHTLAGAQAVARDLLAARDTWSEPLERATPA